MTNLAEQNTKHVTRPRSVARLRLIAAMVLSVLLLTSQKVQGTIAPGTAQKEPDGSGIVSRVMPAVVAVEQRAMKTYGALQLVYTLARSDEAANDRTAACPRGEETVQATVRLVSPAQAVGQSQARRQQRP